MNGMILILEAICFLLFLRTGNFFVKEEGRSQVFAKSNLCCGGSCIIFRKSNYVGEDKRRNDR